MSRKRRIEKLARKLHAIGVGGLRKHPTATEAMRKRSARAQWMTLEDRQRAGWFAVAAYVASCSTGSKQRELDGLIDRTRRELARVSRMVVPSMILDGEAIVGPLKTYRKKVTPAIRRALMREARGLVGRLTR